MQKACSEAFPASIGHIKIHEQCGHICVINLSGFCCLNLSNFSVGVGIMHYNCNMNILSVDPSSTRSGVALIIDDVLNKVDHFTVDKTLDLGRRLYLFGQFLTKFRAKTKLDVVAVERMAVRRNLKTVRMVSYFESCPLYMAGMWNVPTRLIEVTSARSKALGNGHLSKQEVYDLLKYRYSLSEFDNGGSDEADAVVVGLAALKEWQSQKEK